MQAYAPLVPYVWIARYTLGTIFLVAGVSKLRNRDAFVRSALAVPTPNTLAR
jgi:uncharacterized membrane protein YphA (DoxX/SURF4 family)